MRSKANFGAHELAPQKVREMAVPSTTPDGDIVRGSIPPDGLVLALQRGDYVWRWWWVERREAWCLEMPEGGAVEMARFEAWLRAAE